MSSVDISDELVSSFEEERKPIFKTFIGFIISSAIFFVLAIICFIVGGLVYQSPTILIIAVVFFFVASLLFGIGFGYSNKFKNKFVSSIYAKYASLMYDKPVSNPSVGLSYATIKESKFFKRADNYIGKEYFSGSYKGIKFEKCHYELQELRQVHNQNGYTSTVLVTFAEGIFMIFTLNRNIKHDFVVTERSFGGESGGYRQSQKIEFESYEYNKKYTTTCDSKMAAYYFGTPKFIEAMMTFDRTFSGNTYYRLFQNKIYMAVNNYRSKFKFSILKPISKEYIETFIDEIGVPRRIIDMLDFDSEKLNVEVLGGGINNVN
jgi:hypothetical protein